MGWRPALVCCVVALFPCSAALANGTRDAYTKFDQLIACDDALMRDATEAAGMHVIDAEFVKHGILLHSLLC